MTHHTASTHKFPETLRSFEAGNGRRAHFYSLPALEEAGYGTISRLPVCLRIVLESLLRNADGQKVTEADVRALAAWNPKSPVQKEIPFVVARVILQDFTGVPLLVDLAAMRSAVARLGKDPRIVEPLVPVDLVIDHSVQTDFWGSADALEKNMAMEFRRNRERYQFLKWGQEAFKTFRIIPPGVGIIHQVNLEYLAKGVVCGKTPNLQAELFYPDTLVGTDSHTTMINGVGIVGWGVGGIEAEAAMLGQPIYFLTPEVVGVHLCGSLREGVTTTDLALHITQMLRQANVVGKFVEFYGEGAAALPVADRATVANMAPEYGATMGFFPVDSETVAFFRATGRSEAECTALENYFRAQRMFGMPRKGEIDYSAELELDLSSVEPSVAGPSRPQDRIPLSKLKQKSAEFLPPHTTEPLPHGSVVIASITSCTNTSNPGVMLAAGLLAKKAVEHGLRVPPHVKTSLAPGSRVVTDYLKKTGLQAYLDQLGFHVVGYGCMTCIGNSGPLPAEVEHLIRKNNVVAASVLSGNRNFEARIHPLVKANFLMSPPLVVAFALAGRVDIDLTREPIANGVYLRDIWPSNEEISAALAHAMSPEAYTETYHDLSAFTPTWNEIPSPSGALYAWDPNSTYIQEPPFFAGFTTQPGHITEIRGARALLILGDSITTDHISPAGSIKEDSPAAQYLIAHGVAPADFNTYGARRGNDRVMTRGTFANVRLKNLMLPGIEGGFTKLDDQIVPVFDAAMEYQKRGIPLLVFAGQEYGSGSSRDWAAKGPRLLGVRAVIAQSFERIHRSNLIGMGILPCQLPEGVSALTLKLDGSETFDLLGLDDNLQPRQEVSLVIHRADGAVVKQPLIVRTDTPIEVEYYRHGGILPFVLRQLLRSG
ncbi:MAG: aconitate hydratase AcnA [Verrucomicrobiae bacterium]|nr:aconitate hydratase AcnA [Verrucomicrobiae bacterium]